MTVRAGVLGCAIVAVVVGSFVVADADQPIFVKWLVVDDPGDETIREYWQKAERGATTQRIVGARARRWLAGPDLGWERATPLPVRVGRDAIPTRIEGGPAMLRERAGPIRGAGRDRSALTDRPNVATMATWRSRPASAS